MAEYLSVLAEIAGLAIDWRGGPGRPSGWVTEPARNSASGDAMPFSRRNHARTASKLTMSAGPGGGRDGPFTPAVAFCISSIETPLPSSNA
jgi:hypothetical protein